MISIDKAKGVAVILPTPLEKCAPQGRKHLSADALLELLRRSFEKIPDHRGRKCPDFLGGRPDVGLRHVLPEGSLLAGL